MSVRHFYATTPIYYVNDVPHIGHAYTTVAVDAITRFKRLKGFDVLCLTGSDEHGQKVEKSAAEAGIEPKELADRVVTRFEKLWELVNIANDDFIRTTDERHKRAVCHIWKEVEAKGDIYLGHYEDWYCTPCETFLTESQLEGGKCPECHRAAERLTEPSYFFRLSKYAEPLLRHIEDNPEFIQPVSRRNEIVSFLKGGLKDLSVSRTTFSWGIPVPDDPEHIIYVWFDALTNYLSATGYPDGEGYEKFWPAQYHIIGKDILRFHTVYWPAFLMSAGVPLPERVFAHGWWTVEGKKMSKSVGNVVDPYKVIEEYGADQFRYFLLREVPFGLDGDFSVDQLKGRINSDLANDLGNLLSRSVSMIGKFREGKVPVDAKTDLGGMEQALAEGFSELALAYEHSMEHMEFSEALIKVWAMVGEVNAYVDKAAPWKEEDEARRSTILTTLAASLSILSVYVFPFMPASAEEMRSRLGLKGKTADQDFDEAVDWASAVSEVSGCEVAQKGPLFPRVE